MGDLIQEVTMKAKRDFEGFRSGDIVAVSVRVREGEKERIQIYRGRVIRVSGAGASRSFTVRKISGGVGVERTFPFASPVVADVKVISHGKVRRSRLYYLRNLKGKAANIESELFQNSEEQPKEQVSESKEQV